VSAKQKTSMSDDLFYELQDLNKGIRDLRHEMLQQSAIVAGIREQLVEMNAWFSEFASIAASARDLMKNGGAS